MAGLDTLHLGEAHKVVDMAAGSDDYAEGRRAFAEKAPPPFKGH